MSVRIRISRTTSVLIPGAAVLVAAVGLASCTTERTDADHSLESVTSAAATTTPAPIDDDPVADVATLRATGSALSVGAVTVWLDLTTDVELPAPTADEDGAATVQLDLTNQQETLLVAPPEGTTPIALSDGGVVLRDSAGTAIAAVTSRGVNGASSPSVEVRPDGLIIYRSPSLSAGITLTLATAALRTATWAERGDEGGRSLAVVPTSWSRTGGLAADELLWTQLVAAEPEADSQGMHDQLICHAVGAPDKASWNLEPWRPEVGLTQTMLAACNPD